MKKKHGLLIVACSLLSVATVAQPRFRLRTDEANRKVDVWADGRLFTSYCFEEKFRKPVLYPVNTASGIEITRGFPYRPRAFEHADHPHQVGMTFVFGKVNGRDFWNDSYARPAADKYKYGFIRHRKITRLSEGDDRAVLGVETEWLDNDGNVLLTEEATYAFSGSGDLRTVERESVLTAATDTVTFSDNKEGLFAIRLEKAFEEPARGPEYHTDSLGYPLPEKTIFNRGTRGVMRNDRGEEREAGVFGKPARWISNTTGKDGESVTVVLMDHRSNPGYPARAFARGYGLFSLNNLGTQCYDPNAQPFSLTLRKGESLRFRHKFAVVSGRKVTDAEIESMWREFNAGER